MYNKEEVKAYLKNMWQDLKDVDQKLVDFKVNMHNLKKLGYDTTKYNKLMDNVGAEIYKLKIYNEDNTEDILATIK